MASVVEGRWEPGFWDCCAVPLDLPGPAEQIRGLEGWDAHVRSWFFKWEPGTQSNQLSGQLDGTRGLPNMSLLKGISGGGEHEGSARSEGYEGDHNAMRLKEKFGTCGDLLILFTRDRRDFFLCFVYGTEKALAVWLFSLCCLIFCHVYWLFSVALKLWKEHLWRLIIST